MYSIKWFKDNAELYRYIPTNQPQYKSFQTPGALVDETLSKPNMLMLRITGPLGKALKKEVGPNRISDTVLFTFKGF